MDILADAELTSCRPGNARERLQVEFTLIPADLVPLWQDQDEASIRFDVDASGRPQRIMPTAPAPTDDLRCAPRRDARFARHTHLSTLR